MQGRFDPEMRSLRVRLLLPLSLVLGVIGGGTVGYRWLWRDIGGQLARRPVHDLHHHHDHRLW
jgi:hypothetical protein